MKSKFRDIKRLKYDFLVINPDNIVFFYVS